MAKKSAKAKKSTDTALKGLTANCKTALKDLSQKGGPVQVFGRVKNGKLEIDQSSLEEVARKFPHANTTFVAVNAPFDPVASVGLN